MNILVTGGAGYIGSHICKALHSKGYTPICLDTLETGHEWSVKWGPLEKFNIADTDAVKKLIDQYDIDSVVHLAGYIEVGESVRDPKKYIENNYHKSKIFLQTLAECNVSNVVFASTCAVYGDGNNKPIKEEQALIPTSPYAISKLLVEKTLDKMCILHGMSAISLRFFNAAGADPDGEIGEAHDPESHLMPIVVDHALGINKRADNINIFGGSYPTLDGTCIRDYVHVCDLADLHIQALEKLNVMRGTHEAFNVGSGVGFSVRTLIDKVSKYTASKIETYVVDPRPGDVPILVADTTKLLKHFNWTPTRSLDDQIKDTINWRIKHYKPVFH